ncbi:LtfC-like domain-containing protein [Nocardia sp. CA-290969]|uniref:LtfC-like domain-containing protein n=1 Tax=Nocardia sp. CA-290969 TaxID=3239986 RepID=UPI003D8E9A32
MTAPETLITPPPVRVLPVSLDGDLVVVFRNRDPANAGQYLDYPSGVTGVLTIYQDLKTPTADRITATGTPSGHSLPIRVPAVQLNALRDNTLWGFRLLYPDSGFDDGFYDKTVVVGTIMRVDGRS